MTSVFTHMIVDYEQYAIMDVTCAKCHMISNDIITTNCGHIYCNKCISKTKITQCLICIQSITQTAIPHSIIRTINNMNVICNECNDAIVLHKYNDHMNKCEFVLIQCPCGDKILRKNQSIHAMICVLKGQNVKSLNKMYVINALKNHILLKKRIEINMEKIKSLDHKNEEINELEHKIREQKLKNNKYNHNLSTVHIMNGLVEQNNMLTKNNNTYIDHMLCLMKHVQIYVIDQTHPRYISFVLCMIGLYQSGWNLSFPSLYIYKNGEKQFVNLGGKYVFCCSNIPQNNHPRMHMLNVKNINTKKVDLEKIFEHISLWNQSPGIETNTYILTDIHGSGNNRHSNGQPVCDDINYIGQLSDKLNKLSDVYKIINTPNNNEEILIQMIAKEEYMIP